MTKYTLPELSYDYAALEPNISARIMELHHSKHHAAYVAGANLALEQLAEARESNNFANVAKFSKDIEIPIRPFFGVMGVAPPAFSGRISSGPPWIHTTLVGTLTPRCASTPAAHAPRPAPPD